MKDPRQPMRTIRETLDAPKEPSKLPRPMAVLVGVVLFPVAVVGSFVALLLLLHVLRNCEPAPARPQVFGKYSGRRLGVSETLELRADGTFAQTLVMPLGRKFTDEGQWTLTHKQVKLRRGLRFFVRDDPGHPDQSPRNEFRAIFPLGSEYALR